MQPTPLKNISTKNGIVSMVGKKFQERGGGGGGGGGGIQSCGLRDKNLKFTKELKINVFQ